MRTRGQQLACELLLEYRRRLPSFPANQDSGGTRLGQRAGAGVGVHSERPPLLSLNQGLLHLRENRERRRDGRRRCSGRRSGGGAARRRAAALEGTHSGDGLPIARTAHPASGEALAGREGKARRALAAPGASAGLAALAGTPASIAHLGWPWRVQAGRQRCGGRRAHSLLTLLESALLVSESGDLDGRLTMGALEAEKRLPMMSVNSAAGWARDTRSAIGAAFTLRRSPTITHTCPSSRQRSAPPSGRQQWLAAPFWLRCTPTRLQQRAAVVPRRWQHGGVQQQQQLSQGRHLSRAVALQHQLRRAAPHEAGAPAAAQCGSSSSQAGAPPFDAATADAAGLWSSPACLVVSHGLACHCTQAGRAVQMCNEPTCCMLEAIAHARAQAHGGIDSPSRLHACVPPCCCAHRVPPAALPLQAGPPKPNPRFSRKDLKRIKQEGPSIEDLKVRCTSAVARVVGRGPATSAGASLRLLAHSRHRSPPAACACFSPPPRRRTSRCPPPAACRAAWTLFLKRCWAPGRGMRPSRRGPACRACRTWSFTR